MSKGFCYKTLETYDLPRDQLKSFCKYGSKSGYYNISNTRGICNNGHCRAQSARENFQPIPSTEWQQPAAVRGTWNQVKGLYELNPQSNSCVSWRGGNRAPSSNDVKKFQQHGLGRGGLSCDVAACLQWPECCGGMGNNQENFKEGPETAANGRAVRARSDEMIPCKACELVCNLHTPLCAGCIAKECR